jgi:hypothetical protein
MSGDWTLLGNRAITVNANYYSLAHYLVRLLDVGARKYPGYEVTKGKYYQISQRHRYQWETGY